MIYRSHLCTAANFNLNCNDWIGGIGDTATPEVSFNNRRIWEAGVSWPLMERYEGVWTHGWNWTDVVNPGTVADNDINTLIDLVDAAIANGNTCGYVFTYSAPWASARPAEAGNVRSIPLDSGSLAEPADVNDFITFVEKVLTSVGDNLAWVEQWNEPELAIFWTGDDDDMLILNQALYDTVKEYYPLMPVLSNAITNSADLLDYNSRLTYIDRMMGQGSPCDILSVHCYTETATGDEAAQAVQLQASFEAAYRLGQRYGKPVYMTECGHLDWETTTDTIREHTLERCMLLSAAFGIPMWWYSYDNDVVGSMEGDSTRQSWWTDQRAALVGKSCVYKSINTSTGAITIEADGTEITV